MNITRLIDGAEYRAFKYINERRGWKTDRKIIVIESDDWGSIRMPNKQVYEKSLKQGIRVDNCPFCRYDTLASNDDLGALYDVLRKHRDSNNNHPIITANTIVANPDFSSIRKDKFQKYHYELFTETLKRYQDRSFNTWKEGINEKIFFPQLHGREHLNIERWLHALRSNSKEVLFAFENNYFGISKITSQENNPNFLAALDYDNNLGKEIGDQAIDESTQIFKKIFGFNSKSFIGPNYFWHKDTEKVLAEKSVKYLQGKFIQRIPKGKRSYHYLGQRNSLNQIYLTRNVIFEPSTLVQKDWLSSALKEIKAAFKRKSPAIISTHRVTFIGSIFENNRTENLILLDKLLLEITKNWPEVEFMSSVELGDLIDGKDK